MRKFNENEKKCIVKLIELNQSTNALSKKISFKSLQHFLYKEFIEEKVLFNACDEGEPCLYFYRNENKFNCNEVDDFFYRLVEFVVLIQILKDNGLIYLFEDDRELLTFPNLDNNNNKLFYEKCAQNGLVPIKNKLDGNVAKLLLKCINSSVYVSQSLIDLVKNDFLSVEEKNLEEAKVQTKFAIDNLEEAKKQTKFSIQSLEEAKKQTKEADNTFWASLATLIVAMITMVVTIILSKCSVTLDENQNLFKQSINVRDSMLMKNQSDSVIPYIKEINEIVHEIKLNQKIKVPMKK